MNGNFKAICAKSGRPWFTTGKVYEIKDGQFIDDDGDKFPLSSRLDNIDDLRNYASGNMWEEVSDGFDWSAFKSGKFAVHCDTEEKANAFLRECDEQGLTWCGGDKASSHTNWSNFSKQGILYFGSPYFVTYSCSFDLHEKDIIIDYISSAREVHRPAKVGEWIKITNVISEYDGMKVGDIYKVVESYLDEHGKAYYKNEAGAFAWQSEYNVLENYHPQPVFKKAKVGDKIKIVKDTYFHAPEVHIGDVLIVDCVDKEQIRTTSCNWFSDASEEYIIIEEAPEKPERVMPRLEVATMDELLSEIKRRTEGKA